MAAERVPHRRQGPIREVGVTARRAGAHPTLADHAELHLAFLSMCDQRKLVVMGWALEPESRYAVLFTVALRLCLRIGAKSGADLLKS